jgi:hypothetical protein
MYSVSGGMLGIISAVGKNYDDKQNFPLQYL